MNKRVTKMFSLGGARAFGLLSLTIFSQMALAQKSAMTLPEGIFRVRYVGVRTAGITQSLNSQGQATNLMSALERSVSTADLAAADSNLNQLYNALNSYEEGLGDALIMSNFYPEAELIGTQHIIAAEWGMNSDLSLGIIVPMVQLQAKAGFNVDVETNTASIQQKVKGVQALEDGMQTFSQNIPTAKTFTDSVFVSNGYQVPSDFSYFGLGDIELGAKYQVFKNNSFYSTILAGARVPTTTHVAAIDNLLDSSSGDNQWDIAVETANEYRPFSFLTFGAASRYTLQLANRQDVALLANGQSGLPNLNDPNTIQNVRRDLGDILESELSVTGTFGRYLVSATYENTIKAKDTYEGPAGFQVDALAEDTNSIAHRGVLGVKYSTVRAFVNKEVKVPFEVQLSYNTLLAGRNVTRADFARLDLILFLK